MDDELKWANESAEYLQRVRYALRDDFAAAMESFKGTSNRGQKWFHEGKSCIMAIYHYSEEFASDAAVPGACFSAPAHFSRRLDDYEVFVTSMVTALKTTLQPFIDSERSLPSEATNLLDLLDRLQSAIAYVRNRSPKKLRASTEDARTIVERAARQFHEAVLALRKHPHGGTLTTVRDEWDAQYLFRAILASLIHDLRIEEWSPSVAGSSARCEFLLQGHGLMVELKYARRASDGKKFKKELLSDLRDYGERADVDTVVVLIYDPGQILDNAVQLQRDLSKPTMEISDVMVIVSPPRSTHGI